jgi:hypothetical protein
MTFLGWLFNYDFKKSIDVINEKNHLLLILVCFIFGILSFIFASLSVNDTFSYTIFIGFGVSFSTATIVSILYRYVSMKAFGESIAQNLLFNKEFLTKLLSESKIDDMLKNLLQKKLNSRLADIIWYQVIDKITKDHKDYVIYGVHYYITLEKMVFPHLSEYYKCNVKQTFFEKIYSDHLIFYATNNGEFWEILGQKAVNTRAGIELIYKMPVGITDEILKHEKSPDQLKNFFNAKVILKRDFPLNAHYSIKTGSALEKIVGVPVSQKDYCIEVRFDVSDAGVDLQNQEIEKYCEFDTCIYKHKNYLELTILNAYNKIHIDWNCCDTDIIHVYPITTISDTSQPLVIHPHNLKHSIISYMPGLPGQQIVYVWTFKEESLIVFPTTPP